MALRIRKGDLVKVIAGSHKGKTGKVVSTNAAKQTVTVEKIGLVKRHIKPSQLNPRGGTKEVHNPLPLGSVALVTDETKGTTTRIGYKLDKEGNKVRIAKKTGKEIK
jgi:large subunit ribosomal protein L24